MKEECTALERECILFQDIHMSLKDSNREESITLSARKPV